MPRKEYFGDPDKKAVKCTGTMPSWSTRAWKLSGSSDDSNRKISRFSPIRKPLMYGVEYRGWSSRRGIIGEVVV
jgi:hypothetical protein